VCSEEPLEKLRERERTKHVSKHLTNTKLGSEQVEAAQKKRLSDMEKYADRGIAQVPKPSNIESRMDRWKCGSLFVGSCAVVLSCVPWGGPSSGCKGNVKLFSVDCSEVIAIDRVVAAKMLENVYGE